MHADEEHPQRDVTEVLLVIRLGPRQPAFLFHSDLRLLPLPRLLAPQRIQRDILGRLREPRRGILRNAAVGPRLQRTHQRLLHRILRQLQPMRAEMRRQRRHDPRPLAAKQIIRHQTGSARSRPVHADPSSAGGPPSTSRARCRSESCQPR